MLVQGEGVQCDQAARVAAGVEGAVQRADVLHAPLGAEKRSHLWEDPFRSRAEAQGVPAELHLGVGGVGEVVLGVECEEGGVAQGGVGLVHVVEEGL